MPTSVTELRDGIADELAKLTEPLRARLATVDDLIAERLADLTALREVRREIVTALKPIIGADAIAVEPGRNGKPGPKTKKSKQAQASEERIAEGLAYARSVDEFTGNELSAAIKMSTATGSEICRVLLEREQIRLVRVSPGPGRARVYRAVA